MEPNKDAATPGATAVETPAAGTENNAEATGSANTKDSAVPGKVNAAPAAKPGVTEQPKPDYETQFKELQRDYTRKSQSISQLEKQFKQMQDRYSAQAEQLAKLSKAPFDREKFAAEFNEKGPEALAPFFEDREKKLRDDYDKRLADSDARNLRYESKLLVLERRADAENYPDFRKLEPKISELMSDPNCPVDFTKPLDEVMDALYKLAREASSVEAVKVAEAEGKAKAEANLARESATTVAGGGKAAGTPIPDPNKLSLSEMRERVIQLHGVVDRD
jgi:hypothetical protein